MIDKWHVMFISRGMSYGGSGRCISTFSSKLVEYGFKVSIIILRDYEREYYINPKINIIRLGLVTDKIKVGKFNMLTKWLPFIIKTVRKENVDVIIPFGVDICLLSVFGCRKKCKVCVTVRSNPKQEPKTEFWRKIRDYIYKKSDYIWVQNLQQRELMGYIAQEKFFVIPNPIKNELLHVNFEYSGKTHKFVNIGRLTAPKNQITLIKAMELLSKKYNNIQLDIYGEGELRGYLEKYVKDNDLQDKVFLRGRTDNVVDALIKEDVFVLNSQFEGMPNALMEAMAIGMPCISTDCETGPGELIQNRKNGLLISCNDIDELYDAMEYFILYPEKCREYGLLAKQMIKNNYNEDQVADKLADTLEKICAGDVG